MSQLVVANPLVNLASRQLRAQTTLAGTLGREAATQQRSIGSYTPVEAVLDGVWNNQQSTLQGCDSGINNAVMYLQNALASLQEQQTLLQSTLQLANQVVTNPGVQALATLAQLNNQYQTQIAQIQQVVTTSQDAAGNLYLNGSIGSFATGAAGYLPSLAAAGNFTASIVGASNILTSVPTNCAAAINVTKGLIIGALAGTYGVSAAQLPNVTAALNSAAASVIAAGTQASPPTIAQFLESAMQIIPNISMNFAQVQQQFNDAIRVEQICALLPQVLNDAGLTNAGATTTITATQLAACITNSTVPQAVGMVHATTVNGAAVPSTGTQACQYIAALLTPQEKANIITLATTPNSTLDVVGGAVGETTVGVLYAILGQINSFINVGGNILVANNGASVLGATGVGGAVLTSGAAAGGASVAAFSPAGAFPVLPPAAQALVDAYPINAATTLINAAATAPQKVQIGLNASDTVSLQINNTNTTALNIANTGITTLAGAQTAVQNLQNALNFISATIASINGQVAQLESRDTSINTQSDNLGMIISNVEDTNLVENASDMSGINTAIGVIGALIKLSATIQQTIAAAASQILRGQ